MSKRRSPDHGVNNRSRSLLKNNHLTKTTKLEPLRVTSMMFEEQMNPTDFNQQLRYGSNNTRPKANT